MKYDYIIMDFDDTIWPRKGSEQDIEVAKENIELINRIKDRVRIISGNSRASIQTKLVDNNLKLYCDLWCDVNSTCYNNFNFKESIKKLDIIESSVKIMKYLRENNIKFLAIGYDSIYNIKIKPVEDREAFIKQLDKEFNNLGINDIKAIAAGKTTVDIVSIYNTKEVVYNYLELNRYNTFYIGDEIDDGNDYEIAHLCTDYINVKDIYETNRILKELVKNDLWFDNCSR